MPDSLDYVKKNELITKLTNELPVLRAKIRISQEDLAKILGLSRQTYCAYENKLRVMGWNTFLSFLLFFNINSCTAQIIKNVGAFPPELKSYLSFSDRSSKGHS